MGTAWLEGFVPHKFTRWPGGAYVDQGAGRWKLLLHTLEGSFESGMAAFRGGTGCPHFTVDLDRRIYTQHIPINRSAYALRNMRGGTQTNRDHVIQVEIAGFARDTRNWSAAKLMALAYNVIEPIMDAQPGIELAFANFDYDDSAEYGLRNDVELSPGEWDAFSGILGHVHAPENTHWDPGALNTAALLGLLTEGEMGDMGLFQKISDPDTRREWVAVEHKNVAHVREFSSFRGQGEVVAGLGYVIDDFVNEGLVKVVEAGAPLYGGLTSEEWAELAAVK